MILMGLQVVRMGTVLWIFIHCDLFARLWESHLLTVHESFFVVVAYKKLLLYLYFKYLIYISDYTTCALKDYIIIEKCNIESESSRNPTLLRWLQFGTYLPYWGKCLFNAYWIESRHAFYPPPPPQIPVPFSLYNLETPHLPAFWICGLRGV